MKAIRQHEFGGPAVLRVEDLDEPVPGEGQVRIRVEAAGVHLADTAIRSGSVPPTMPLPALPMTPGREVAGVVDATGPGVDPAWRGERVVAHLGLASGGYAELALAPAESLHRLPLSVSAPAAVAMMGTGRMTMGILALARVGPADVVLITSAAGGIGSLLIQAVRRIGATVVGAAGPSKLALVRELGADLAVDYDDPVWTDRIRTELGGRGVTVAFDGVGGAAGRAAFEVLAPGGRLIVHGWSAGRPTRFEPGEVVARGLTVVSALGAPVLQLPGGLRALEEQAQAALVAGELSPSVQTFPLAEAARAHAELEGRATSGKVVLVP